MIDGKGDCIVGCVCLKKLYWVIGNYSSNLKFNQSVKCFIRPRLPIKNQKKLTQ